MQSIKEFKELCHRVKVEQGVDRLFVSNSYGADALAMLCLLRESEEWDLADATIYTYEYMSLPWVTEHRAYVDAKLGIKSVVVPSHLRLYADASQCFLEPTEIIAAQAVEEKGERGHVYYDRDTVEQIVRKSARLPESVLTAVGVKAGDSVFRRKAMYKTRGISGGKWYPIWDFEKGDVKTVLARHGMKVSMDYELFGLSFETPFFRHYWEPLMLRCPATWARICEMYPLLPLHVARYTKYYPDRKLNQKLKHHQFKTMVLPYKGEL